MSLNIPEGVIFTDYVKRIKNDRCFLKEDYFTLVILGVQAREKSNLNNMAGEDGRMYVLLFMTLFMRLPLIRLRSRFQLRLRLLTIGSNKKTTEEC